jgi:hypothetical protein
MASTRMSHKSKYACLQAFLDVSEQPRYCHADFAHYRAHLPSVAGFIALKACRRSSLRITKPVKIPLAFKGRAGPKAGSTSESLDCQGHSLTCLSDRFREPAFETTSENIVRTRFRGERACRMTLRDRCSCIWNEG